MATIKQQIENEVESETGKFRLSIIKKHIPTFTVNAIHKEVVNIAFDNIKGNRYKYTIEVGKTDGKVFTFPFYDSIAAFKTGKKLDIFDAIYCMITDSNCYKYADNFIDFVVEFGYITDEKEQLIKAKKAYDGCKNTYIRLNRVFNSHELEVLEGACYQY